MSGEFSSDEIEEIVTMILGTVHPVFVGNFNPVLTGGTDFTFTLLRLDKGHR